MYAHLHNHSEFSPLDGLQHISDMFERAARFGQPGVGITDHGRLGGMVDAAKASEKTGVKLVPGLEAYFVPDFAEVADIHAMKAADRGGRDKNVGGAGKARYHMTLLATTNLGYQELMRASTFAWGNQRVNSKFPLFDIAMIERFFTSGDVIATSGCIGSYANQLFLSGQEKRALEHVAQMSDIFGSGNYYIEVMAHDFPEQLRAQRWHLRLADRLGLPLLGTNDTHYSDRAAAHTHQEFLCIQTGDKITSPSFSFSSDENDFCSSEYMERVLPEDTFHGAISNTVEIVDRTTYKMDISGKNYHIPKFDVPPEYGSEREMLRTLCMKRLPLLYKGKAYDNALEALDYQLGIIDQMGFNGYFLILWDAMNWGRDHGIRFGPGRGSAAGSVVSYCLHITDIDPIKHGLYFERFLNPSRISMPDIDIDIENARQGELVDYMVSKYGADRVGRLATYMTLKGKSAIKDAARIYDIPSTEGQALSDMMPFGDEITVAEAISDDEPVREREDAQNQAIGAWKQARDLRDEYRHGSKNTRDALDCAANVQGYIRGTGIHAAGVVVTPGPFSDLFPMSGGDEHALACEYDKHHIDDIGALKFDFLGLKNLDVITEAVERIKGDLGIDIDIDIVPLDDPEVFKMLARGDTETVFQMESPGMTRLAMDMKIDCFDDISACLALYRPGPLGSNIHKQFVEAKRNGGMAENVIHEDLRDLLKETYGLCLPAGTKILMADGSEQMIESISVGDMVMSYDEDSGEFRPNKVVDHAYTGVKRVWIIETIDEDEDFHYMRSSEDHKFLVDGVGFVSASDIEPGMSLVVNDGGKRSTMTVTESRDDDGWSANMYDITVEDDHTYVANGFVVHNCVYQEQISAIAQHYAGYDAAEADSFRKAVGKKDRAILDKQEESFKARMTERGYGSVTHDMWEMIIHFAEYAFNKAHTVSYAKITYQTAWLKHYYPAQFGAGCLKVLDDNKVLGYIKYLGARGIKVLAPDANRSGVRAMTIPSKSGNRDEDSIVIGLSTVASCGWQLCQDIVDARGDEDFTDILDFVQRTINYGAKLNKTNLTTLINSGAFDALSLGASRESLRLMVPDILDAARGMGSASAADEDEMDLFSVSDIPETDPWRDMATALTTSKAENSPISDACIQRSVLGFFIGGHPMERFNEVRDWAGLSNPILTKSISVRKVVEEGQRKHKYRVEGVVISKDNSFNDASNKPVELIIEDAEGYRIRIIAFGEMRQYLIASCNEGDVVVATGTFGYDSWSGNPRLSYLGIDVIDVSRLLSSKATIALDGSRMSSSEFRSAIGRVAQFITEIRDEKRESNDRLTVGEFREYNIFLSSSNGRGGFMRFPGEDEPLVLLLDSEEADEVQTRFSGR